MDTCSRLEEPGGVCIIPRGAVAFVLHINLRGDTASLTLRANCGLTARPVAIAGTFAAKAVASKAVAKFLRCCL
jgi:hypothetical protein